MGKWTALAEVLDDDIREPGFGAAAVFASASRARVDPRPLQAFATVAVALTNGDARRALMGPEPPNEDHPTLLTWTENLEAHVAVLLRRCMDLGRAAHDEHEDAAKARARALSAAMTAGPTDTPEQRAAAESAQAEARAQAEDAARVMADCEVALEVLGQADCRLRYALNLLRAVPADLDETYEAPFALVAHGGRMPHSGHFIAPSGPAETVAGRGAA